MTQEEILLKHVGKLAVAGLKWKTLAERRQLIFNAMDEYASEKVREALDKVEQEKIEVYDKAISEDREALAMLFNKAGGTLSAHYAFSRLPTLKYKP